jgi:hypothetical protein
LRRGALASRHAAPVPSRDTAQPPVPDAEVLPPAESKAPEGGWSNWKADAKKD